MRRIITTYFAVVLTLSLGFFGVGALASVLQPVSADQETPHPGHFGGARRDS